MATEISISEDLVTKIEKLIREHPELEYENVDDFVSEALIAFFHELPPKYLAE